MTRPEKKAVALKDIFETLAAFKDTRINCDLKEYGLEEDVLALARACGLPAKRILYSGSVKPAEQSLVCPWREVEVFWNVEECIPDVYALDESGQGNPLTEEETEKLIADCRKYDIRVVNINEKYVTPEFLSAMKENGLGISAWTVNETGADPGVSGSGNLQYYHPEFHGGHGASPGCQSAVTQNTVK